MRKYTVTYAIYYEVEVVAKNEEKAFSLGKKQIRTLTVKPDNWELAGSEYVEENEDA
jgi:hypothetical protein